jgi:hypothetical protein
MSLSLRSSLVSRRYLTSASNYFIKRSTPACVSRGYSSVTKAESTSQAGQRPVQSKSPLAPIGVEAALTMSSDGATPKPKIFDEFSLNDRVAIVSGGNRGLGLEMALALSEAGARAVYCLDLPQSPSSQFEKAAEYVRKMERGDKAGQGRLEYIPVDVRDQEKLWKIGEEIGSREGRMDVCVAAAGVLKAHTDCLEYPARQFQDVFDVNVNGVLFTAQAAGRQMQKFGNGGSIILIASMSGSITNRVCKTVFMSCSLENFDVIVLIRIMHGPRITLASLLYYRWLGAWLANLGRAVFVSTLFPLGIYTRSKS